MSDVLGVREVNGINHLGTDGDLAAIVPAIESARALSRQVALDSIREAEVVPGPKVTSCGDLVDLPRLAAGSFGHAMGTAKIGVAAGALVDNELRVHGLRGLPVAGASLIPSITSGPTNAPAFRIRGRAAELIKAATA